MCQSQEMHIRAAQTPEKVPHNAIHINSNSINSSNSNNIVSMVKESNSVVRRSPSGQNLKKLPTMGNKVLEVYSRALPFIVLLLAVCSVLQLIMSNPLEHIRLALQLEHERSASLGVMEKRRKLHDECIVVFDIPEVGGQALRDSVGEIASEMHWRYMKWPVDANSEASPIKQASELKEWNYSIRKPMHRDAIHIGHLLPHFLSLSGTEHCMKMTMLREPTDRVVSLFERHKRKEEEWDVLLKEREDFACRKEQLDYTNDMTRILSGAMSPANSWNAFQSKKKIRNCSVDNNDLHRARHLLLDMDLVCFADDMEGCKRDLRNLVGLPLSGKADASSSTQQQKPAEGGNDATLSKERPLSEIESVNIMDSNLYAWAVEQFRPGSLSWESPSSSS